MCSYTVDLHNIHSENLPPYTILRMIKLHSPTLQKYVGQQKDSLLYGPKKIAECGRVGGVCNDILQLLHCIGQASYINEEDRWPLLDHGIHIGSRQVALDYVIGAAHLRLQLIWRARKKHLRLQRYHARHIAARQQPLEAKQPVHDFCNADIPNARPPLHHLPEGHVRAC